MKRLISSIITAVTVMLTATGCGSYNNSNNTQAESSAPTLTNLSAEVKASVASDYKYTIQDVINLQDFLLARPTEEDLTGDDRWDVFDLCLMRREVFKDFEKDSDTLVIYFSRTGNTEKIAEYLIELTDADSYVIEAAVLNIIEGASHTDLYDGGEKKVMSYILKRYCFKIPIKRNLKCRIT